MNKVQRLLGLLVASCALLSAHASAQELAWHVINHSASFRFSASGDPCGADGATVFITRQDGATETSGGALTALDVSRFAGKRVTVTAQVSTTHGAANGMIWLRAHGPTPDANVFQTSQGYPVRPDQAPVTRAIRLTVPKDATEAALGVMLNGPGEARVTALRLAVSADIASNVDAPVLLDEAVSFIRMHALVAGGVDWDAYLKDAHAHLVAGQPARAAYPAIQAAIGKLNDGHSHFLGSDAAWAELSNDGTRAAPDVHLLPGGIGYVSLPGFSGPPDAQLRYVDSIASAMASAAPKVTQGWIVDLREDTGGNMWPMLGSVQSLLGSDPVGSARAPSGEGPVWRAGYALPSGAKPQPDLTSARVAVILGPHTASAGEAVAVAFHGRPATRSFGMPTSGKANSNETVVLKDGSLLIVKVANDTDRHGQVFGEKVMPDELVGGDAVLDRATEWLAHDASL